MLPVYFEVLSYIPWQCQASPWCSVNNSNNACWLGFGIPAFLSRVASYLLCGLGEDSTLELSFPICENGFLDVSSLMVAAVCNNCPGGDTKRLNHCGNPFIFTNHILGYDMVVLCLNVVSWCLALFLPHFLLYHVPHQSFSVTSLYPLLHTFCLLIYHLLLTILLMCCSFLHVPVHHLSCCGPLLERSL